MSKGKKSESESESNIDFTRFQNLTKRLVAVPKREVDELRQQETVRASKDRSVKRVP